MGGIRWQRRRSAFPLYGTHRQEDPQAAGALVPPPWAVSLRRAQAMRKMEADSLADLVRMYDRLE